ncbi:MAG: tetratricopeptide repeat protein, partial [Chloroflexota bacterium]|nr:tetratricopeptide repeat protein [Chloroflexota bacterium]
VFARLSIFRGGFTRDAVEEVAGASVPILGRLVSKSLLQLDPTKGRYQLHELLRQYGAEKMAQNPDAAGRLADRHSAYYCGFLTRHGVHFNRERQREALAAAEAEADNVQVAWYRAVQQRHSALIQSAMEGLGYFYMWQGRNQKGQKAFQHAAEHLMQPASDRAMMVGERSLLAGLLAWQGRFTYLLGDAAGAKALLEQGLTVLDRPELAGEDTRAERAFIYAQLGIVAMTMGHEGAWSWYERSLALFRALGCQWEMSEVLARMGQWMHILAEFQQAEQLFDESLAIKRTLGDHRGVADVLGQLSHMMAEQGHLERAERLARESNALYHELQNRYGMASGLWHLGVTLIWQGKNREAQPLFEGSLALARELGNQFLLAESYSLLGYTLSALGQHDEAYTQAQAGLRLHREIADPRQVAWSLYVLGWVLASMGAYAEAEQTLRESMSLYRHYAAETNEPNQLGWSLSLLGYVLWRRGDHHQAQTVLLEVLSLSIRLRDFLPLLTAFVVIALILGQQGEKERAVELYALVSRYPAASENRGWPEAVGQELAVIIATLPPEVAEAARARAEALDLWQTAEALAAELHARGWDRQQ